MYDSDGQTLTTSDATIEYDTELYDTGSYGNAANNRIDLNKAGDWLVCHILGSLYDWDPGTYPESRSFLKFYNGSTATIAQGYQGPYGCGPSHVLMAMVTSDGSGDYVYSQAAASGYFDAVISSGTAWNQLTAVWLGSGEPSTEPWNAAYCLLRSSADQTITTGAGQTTVTLGTEVFDSGSYGNAANNRIDLKTKGYWLIIGHTGMWTGITEGAGTVQMNIVKDALSWGVFSQYYLPRRDNTLAAIGVLRVTATTGYVYMRAANTTGGNGTLTSGYCTLMAILLKDET